VLTFKSNCLQGTDKTHPRTRLIDTNQTGTACSGVKCLAKRSSLATKINSLGEH